MYFAILCLHLDRLGLHGAADAHRHRVDIARSHGNGALTRIDCSGIARRASNRLASLTFNAHEHIAVALTDKNVLTTCHDDRALGRDNLAAVTHSLSQKRHEIARNQALVDDVTLEICKAIDAADKVIILDVSRRGIEAIHIEAGGAAKEHASGVDQIDPAVG